MSIRNFIMCFLLGIAHPAFAANHDFTGLPLDSGGWTDLSALVQANSRIVYVSTSGNDGTAQNYTSESFADPFNPTGEAAYQTIAAAEDQMRDGYPDIMLLKRGDDFGSGNITWDKNGESATTPMIVAAYGEESGARPIIGQFNIDGSGTRQYLILAHIQLDDEERCMNGRDPMTRILIEGCYFPPGPGTGIVIQDETTSQQGTINYLALRRNVIAGRFRPSGDGTYVHGMYIDDSTNLLVEENIFDDNGEDENDAESDTPDQRSHNTYVMLTYDGTGTQYWRYNISARASSHCYQFGQGGECLANLAVECPIAFQTSREDEWYEGISGNYKYNVALHGTDINSTTDRGWGIIVSNADGQTIEENIIGDNTDSNAPNGIYVSTQLRGAVQMEVTNVTIKNNIIHNWDGDGSISDGQGFSLSGTDGAISNITLTGNKVAISGSSLRIIDALNDQPIVASSGNSFYGTRTASEQFQLSSTEYDLDGYKTAVSDTTSDNTQTVPSGDYGITDYLTSVSETATMESFYSNLRTQRKGDWDTKYTALPIINFVRGKFGLGAIASAYAGGSASINPAAAGSMGINPAGAGSVSVSP